MLEFLFVLLDELKEAFNSWKTDWTSARASKIDTIESRLSNERAGKLDNLNRPLNSIETTVNTRASQTSVDTIRTYVDDLENRLTSTRASKLDNLDARVSTKANQTTADNIYSKVSNGFVKRVQRGLVVDTSKPEYRELPSSTSNYSSSKTYYRDISIPYNVANIGKSFLTIDIGWANSITSSQPEQYIAQLINGNTIRIITKSSSVPIKELVISWQIIEY